MLQPAIQDKRRWWTREDVLLLILLGLLYFLPAIGRITLFDRDEPRFATAARTMMHTGNYIVPMFNGQERPDKPPLVYWLMDAAAFVTGGWRAGGGELVARLPSALCSIGTLLVVYFMTGVRFGRVTGLVAAMMLGSCALFVIESRLATADATMVFFIALCMACAWQAWDAAGGGRPGETAALPRADFLLDRSTERIHLALDQMNGAPGRGRGAAGGERRRIPFGVAMLFWIALALGTLAKGVPLVFVFVPMIVLSLFTGPLGQLFRAWRSHLHITRLRIALALTVAFAAVAGVAFALRSDNAANNRNWVIVLGLLVIGMILTPGLPGVVFRCIVRANWRWWGQLRPLIGFPVLIVLVGWWVVWAGMATDWKLIETMVGTHFLERVAGPLLHAMHVHFPSGAGVGGNDAVAHYGKPPGFYTLLVWVTFFPWSVLIVPAGYHTVRRARRKTALAIDPRPYFFLLAWIIPMWILLELARGKLPHYPLPTYIALSILCADTVVQSWARLSEVLAAAWFAAMRWVMLGIWVGLGVALLIGARMFLSPALFWRCVPVIGALAAVGVATTSAWNRPTWVFVTVLGWGAALMLLETLVLPDIGAIEVSRFAGARIRQLRAAEPEYRVAACGYEEPTLVFYTDLGAPILMFDKVTANLVKTVPFTTREHPVLPGEKWVVAVDAPVLAELEGRGLLYYPLPTYHGLDIANFKPVAVTLITNYPPLDYSPTATRAATQGAAEPASAP